MNRFLYLTLFAVPLTLGGCLSISSTKSPETAVTDPCQGKEQVCRDLCGSVGVQTFSCNAKAGEEMNYKCECQKVGQRL